MMNQLYEPGRTISVGRILGYILIYALIVFLALVVERHETFLLLTTYLGGFLVYGYLSLWGEDQMISRIDHFFMVLLIGTLCFVEPSLSDDIYRFVWDGRLSAAGLDPFLFTPTELLAREADMSDAGLTRELYQSLNSPDYYTVYPPIMQWVFEWTARLAGGSVYWQGVGIKLILGAALWGSWYYLIRIFRLMSLPEKHSLLFILNPLLLIEVVGNVHFEGLQVFFIALSIYLIMQKRIYWAAVAWGLAVAVKLLPLMLIPVIMRYLGLKKGILFAGISGLVILGCFLPFGSVELVENMSSSIDLYFRSFEFNASIYYLVREVGYYVRGYNLIAYIGPALSGLFLVIYAGLLFIQRPNKIESMLSTMLWGLTAYFLLATTVHPWYLITPLFFAVILRQWYMVIWTGLVFLSYAAYKINGVSEIHLLLWIEYTFVLLVMVFHKRIALFVSETILQRQKE